MPKMTDWSKLKIGPIAIKTIDRGAFERSIGDVREILREYDQRPKRSDSWRHVDGEAFLRAAVILTVTAWETFIEDTLESQFSIRLSKATAPSDVQAAFNYCADKWLGTKERPKPPSLANWTGEGWKSQLRSVCIIDVNGISNPNAKVTGDLFRQYLGIDVTREWRWRGVGPRQASNMLDALLKHRGQLVHRGRELFKKAAVVTRNDAGGYVDLVMRLMDRTEIALGIQPRYP